MPNTSLFCRVAHSPLRKEASDPSEMVSEFLFGELAELIESNGNWLKVRSLEDDYEGYVDSKHFLSITDYEVTHWKQARKRIHVPSQIHSARGIINLPIGSFISHLKSFEIQQNNYSSHQEAQEIQNWELFAKQFLNTSYLWGGRTEYGIDCSGFSQQVQRFRGIELPRDASMQVQHGTDIAYADRKPGDVAFFQNEKGKVTHVGILLDSNKIIHSSGFVKIDDFNEKGIINIEDGTLSHVYYGIRRY